MHSYLIHVQDLNLKIVQEHLKHRRMEILLRHLAHARPVLRVLAFQSYKCRRAWRLPGNQTKIYFIRSLCSVPIQTVYIGMQVDE